LWCESTAVNRLGHPDKICTPSPAS
jgi:hypothetical protein